MGEQQRNAALSFGEAQGSTAHDRRSLALPPAGAHVHIIGIGGIGTSALARVLARWGYRVTGSDAAASVVTAALLAEGIAVTIGHQAEAVAGADLVVYSAAVRETNPELAAALAAGTPTVKRAALLGLIANARDGLAVAGTHGKSTTSAMLAKVCIDAGRDPSFFVGAILQDFGTNARPGGGDLVVVEADEYDRSFLQLFPRVAIVTNIEHDHPDIYPTFAEMRAAYLAFLAQVQPGGTIVISADDSGCVALLPAIVTAANVTVVTYGRAAGADWRIVSAGDTDTIVHQGQEVAHLTLGVPGEHNRRNALAALAAADAVGIAPEVAAASLAGFTGTGRRFELKGEAHGITFVDDYAHHPTEVAVNLRAAHERYPGRPLWAVFQPHTYSRTKLLLRDFAESLAEADRIVLLDIYAARETDTLGVSADDILALLPVRVTPIRVARPADAAAALLAEYRAGRLGAESVVLTLGAGDVTEVGPLVLDALRDNPPASPGQGEDTLDPSWEPLADADPPAKLQILRDEPVARYTSFRIGGPADFLARPADAASLGAALGWAREARLPVTIIGGGSNLICSDRGIRGLAISFRAVRSHVEVVDEGDIVRVRVPAERMLSGIARWCCEQGWAGLDWAVGLPGTVGGAVANNAGAHGTEMIDNIESVTVMGLDGVEQTHERSWLRARYRHTVLRSSDPAERPAATVVVAVTLRLQCGDRDALLALADEHAAWRKEHQPRQPCAGSIFKNPPGTYAGLLIEQAGLKGYQVGGVQISPVHANFIVNVGNATVGKARAADVQAVIRHAQEVVFARTGIQLETEVEFIGEWDNVTNDE